MRYFYLLMKSRSQGNSVKFNPTLKLTQPPSSCRSTSDHMLGFWLTFDGHYSLYDGNNNFNAALMIVIIMLGTHSPNRVLIAVWQPQQGVSKLTSKVWFTSQWSAWHCSTRGRLSFSWWTSPFWSCSSIWVQALEDQEKGSKGLQWFFFPLFQRSPFHHHYLWVVHPFCNTTIMAILAKHCSASLY